MNEYRCTRNDPYKNPNCPGHTDLSARQGYYVDAENESAAIAEMGRDFPSDVGGFTATYVKPSIFAVKAQP